MGIRHPIISEIAPETYLINEFGLCNHYLLVGSDARCSSTAAWGIMICSAPSLL